MRYSGISTSQRFCDDQVEPFICHEARRRICADIDTSSNEECCFRLLFTVVMLSFFSFFASTGVFLYHYIEEVRGETEHRWQVYVAVAISLFCLSSQWVFYSVIFKPCIQGPLIKRYQRDGIGVAGKVVHRVMKEIPAQPGESEGKEFYLVFLVYRLMNSHGRDAVYAKKFIVSRTTYHWSEFSLVVIPDVPSSAILAEKYNELVEFSAEVMVACYILLSFCGVSIWLLLFFLVLPKLPEGDFWRNKGTLLLFGLSQVCCMTAAYLKLVQEKKKCLNGAKQIDANLLPAGFLPRQDTSSTAEEIHDDDEDDSEIELV